LKDEECVKLLKVRDQIGEELEELTASLFEVSYKSSRLLPSTTPQTFRATDYNANY